MCVFFLFSCSQKDRGICTGGERKSQQQIATEMKILNYLFTQKTILCDISIVNFFRSGWAKTTCLHNQMLKTILKVQWQKLFQNWNLLRNIVSSPNQALIFKVKN